MLLLSAASASCCFYPSLATLNFAGARLKRMVSLCAFHESNLSYDACLQCYPQDEKASRKKGDEVLVEAIANYTSQLQDSVTKIAEQ